VVIGSAAADGLNGAAGIDERHGQQIAVRGQPVADDEGAEAAGCEPVGDLAAFEVGGEIDVGAAGKDDNREAVGGARLGVEDGDGGDVFAGMAWGASPDHRRTV